MIKFRKQKSIDSFCQKERKNNEFDFQLASFFKKYKKPSVLFSKYGKTENFRTESLSLHFVKKDKNIKFLNLDSVLSFEKKQPLIYSRVQRKDIFLEIRERYLDQKNYLKDWLRGSVQGVSMVRVWNVSMVGSLIFGMFIMTFIYRYLGQEVSAVSMKNITEENSQLETLENQKGEVLGEEDENIENYVSQIMGDFQKDSENKEKLEQEIREMTKGHPIEKMAPIIAKEDRTVAAFLVAIAKKESNWGKRIPVLDGKDCYNYWGYRLKRERMGTGGHTCFDSPEDAVKTVSKRLSFLVSNEERNTPGKMVVWKCGYDCSWDNPNAVKKWIDDVDYYFKKFDKF